MAENKIKQEVAKLLAEYDPAKPGKTAASLRKLWLQFQPRQRTPVASHQRDGYELVGTPVPTLKAIGKELGKTARKQVKEFLPLARLLWDDYGREGRVVAVVVFGAMELAAPQLLLPVLLEICRSCRTWEDADLFAMNALEPIVRKDPKGYLGAMEPWLDDQNKWARRASVTVVGRLPMKHPDTTARCMPLIERLLMDQDVDVKKACSFAIRLAARGDVRPVCAFLKRHVPPKDPAATWVLCDSVRSMTKQFLPGLTSLLPSFKKWARDKSLTAAQLRSVESAIKTLGSASRGTRN